MTTEFRVRVAGKEAADDEFHVKAKTGREAVRLTATKLASAGGGKTFALEVFSFGKWRKYDVVPEVKTVVKVAVVRA